MAFGDVQKDMNLQFGGASEGEAVQKAKPTGILKRDISQIE